MIAWPDLPTHRDWLGRELARLLDFGRELPAEGGGAVWLDDDGHPDASRPVQTCTAGKPRIEIEAMRLFHDPRLRSLSPGREFSITLM